MNHLAALLFLTALLILAPSCASLEQTSVSPAILAQLGQRGVPSGTIKRISTGRVLDFDDILSLLKARVSETGIVAYIKSTHAPYSFTRAEFQQLLDAGAGSGLIIHLAQSLAQHEASKAKHPRGSRWTLDPYFNDPLFRGSAPFRFAFPRDWNDPRFVFDPL